MSTRSRSQLRPASARTVLAGLVLVGLPTSGLTGCSSDADTPPKATTTTRPFDGPTIQLTPADPDGTAITVDTEELQLARRILQARLRALDLDAAEVRVAGGALVVEGISVDDLPEGSVDDASLLRFPRVGFRPVLVAPRVGDLSEVTPAEDITPDAAVTLAAPPDDTGRRALYDLGPEFFGGDVVEDASVTDQYGGWAVQLVLKAGDDGIGRFNEAAAACFNATPECPATSGGTAPTGTAGVGALAVVLDGLVVSAPAINAPDFERDQIAISGAYDEAGANELALAFRLGSEALPFDLRIG